jgi:hypothetical protein
VRRLPPAPARHRRESWPAARRKARRLRPDSHVMMTPGASTPGSVRHPGQVRQWFHVKHLDVRRQRRHFFLGRLALHGHPETARRQACGRPGGEVGQRCKGARGDEVKGGQRRSWTRAWAACRLGRFNWPATCRMKAAFLPTASTQVTSRVGSMMASTTPGKATATAHVQHPALGSGSVPSAPAARSGNRPDAAWPWPGGRARR